MLNRPILRLPNKPNKPVPQDFGLSVDAVPPLDMIATLVQTVDVVSLHAPQKSYHSGGIRCPQYGGPARQRFTL